jgi:hypothetical protein
MIQVGVSAIPAFFCPGAKATDSCRSLMTFVNRSGPRKSWPIIGIVAPDPAKQAVAKSTAAWYTSREQQPGSCNIDLNAGGNGR